MVHLQPYEAEGVGDDGDSFSDNNTDSFNSALNLSKKADIIILDWHLGDETPRNSIDLLRNLGAESAIRYIVVLSQYDQKFQKEMEEAGMIENGSESHEDSKLFYRKGEAWLNGQGTHIIVMKKPDLASYTSSEFSDTIFTKIFDLMSEAHPDYLHWAAIEIVAKLRHSVPGWIQSIPSGTDAAVLSELISEETEARALIPENLLEDLTHLAKLHTLDSLDSKNCHPNDWPKPAYAIQLELNPKNDYQKCIHFFKGASEIDKKVANKIKEQKNNDHCAHQFLASQHSFAEFCERISSDTELSPTFGAVYIPVEFRSSTSELDQNENAEDDTIYLCLSQECDCLRSESLMVLEGTVNNATASKDGIARLSFRGKVFGFLPVAKSLQSANSRIVEHGSEERRLEGFQKIGQLRKATARRILNQFWNHMSRSAVNLPRFTLQSRDRK